MSAADLEALAARVEALTDSTDRGLEVECAIALGLPPEGHRRGHYRDEWTEGRSIWLAPPLLSDPSAPLRVIERLLGTIGGFKIDNAGGPLVGCTLWPDPWRNRGLKFHGSGKGMPGHDARDLPGRLARAALAAALRLAARSAGHG